MMIDDADGQVRLIWKIVTVGTLQCHVSLEPELMKSF